MSFGLEDSLRCRSGVCRCHQFQRLMKATLRTHLTLEFVLRLPAGKEAFLRHLKVLPVVRMGWDFIGVMIGPLFGSTICTVARERNMQTIVRINVEQVKLWSVQVGVGTCFCFFWSGKIGGNTTWGYRGTTGVCFGVGVVCTLSVRICISTSRFAVRYLFSYVLLSTNGCEPTNHPPFACSRVLLGAYR